MLEFLEQLTARAIERGESVFDVVSFDGADFAIHVVVVGGRVARTSVTRLNIPGDLQERLTTR